MAYSDDPHGDAEKRTRRMHVFPLGEASHDAETATSVAVDVYQCERRTVWICSCHACDRTKLKEGRSAEKSGKGLSTSADGAAHV